nr:myb-like DNA binding protein [Cryptomonas sp.]
MSPLSVTENVNELDYKFEKENVKLDIEKKFIFKKGPFTRSEQVLVDKALDKVLNEEGIPYDINRGRKILSMERKELPRNFWKRVAMYVPARTVESIYDHARRRLSSKNYQGKWTEDEVLRLKKLIELHGQKWTKIGSSLNRLPGACYDKWRDALKSGEYRRKGKWSQEERCKLIQLVTLQIGHGFIQEITPNKLIKWTVVADKLGSRSYLQCRNEWARFFSPGSKIKLTFSDSYRLVQSIFLSEVSDETEIKWGQLIDGVPAHKTYNKWRSLCKRFLKENESMNGLNFSFKTAVYMIKNNLPKIIQKKRKVPTNIPI